MCVLRNVVVVHEEQRTGETEHSCPSCAKRKSCSRRKMWGLFVNKILRVPKREMYNVHGDNSDPRDFRDLLLSWVLSLPA